MESTTLLDTGHSTPTTGVGANEALAAKLYPEPVARPIARAPNAEVQALRDAEPARAIYRDDMQMGSAPRELALAVTPDLSRDALQGQASIIASIMTDIGFSRDDVSQLA